MIPATIEALAVETGAIIAVISLLAAGLRTLVRVTKVIDGQLEAMRDNTAAVEHLTERMGPLADTVDEHGQLIRGLDTRVITLERRS